MKYESLSDPRIDRVYLEMFEYLCRGLGRLFLPPCASEAPSRTKFRAYGTFARDLGLSVMLQDSFGVAWWTLLVAEALTSWQGWSRAFSHLVTFLCACEIPWHMKTSRVLLLTIWTTGHVMMVMHPFGMAASFVLGKHLRHCVRLLACTPPNPVP